MADIFVCYRRGDSRGDAGRLADSLDERFKRSQIFRDVESLAGGTDYKVAIESAITQCVAMLAVIGPRWLDMRSDDGTRRLDNPDDFIVLEIGAALSNGITVIPVLVGGAKMPSADQLPAPLEALASRQAVELSDARWDYDMDRLIERLCQLPGLGSRLGNLCHRFKLRSPWLAVPAAMIVAVVLLAIITQVLTGGDDPVPPAGLRLLDADLSVASRADSNCLHPLDCDSRGDRGVSSMIRLQGSDVRYDQAAQQLHVIVTINWVLREGNTNLAHRGYTGKVHYSAAAQPAAQRGRVVIGELIQRGHSLKPYNGLLAYTLGWLEIPFLLGRDTVMTTELRRRLSEADAVQALADARQ